MDTLSLSTPSTEGYVESQENVGRVSSTDIKRPHPNSSPSKWLPAKLKLCGEVVGLSVSKCDKGWESLFEFAEFCQKLNKEFSSLHNSKRKGSREMQGLQCTINYDKGGSKQKGASSKAKTAQRL